MTKFNSSLAKMEHVDLTVSIVMYTQKCFRLVPAPIKA